MRPRAGFPHCPPAAGARPGTVPREAGDLLHPFPFKNSNNSASARSRAGSADRSPAAALVCHAAELGLSKKSGSPRSQTGLRALPTRPATRDDRRSRRRRVFQQPRAHGLPGSRPVRAARAVRDGARAFSSTRREMRSAVSGLRRPAHRARRAFARPPQKDGRAPVRGPAPAPTVIPRRPGRNPRCRRCR